MDLVNLDIMGLFLEIKKQMKEIKKQYSQAKKDENLDSKKQLKNPNNLIDFKKTSFPL